MTEDQRRFYDALAKEGPVCDAEAEQDRISDAIHLERAHRTISEEGWRVMWSVCKWYPDHRNPLATPQQYRAAVYTPALFETARFRVVSVKVWAGDLSPQKKLLVEARLAMAMLRRMEDEAVVAVVHGGLATGVVGCSKAAKEREKGEEREGYELCSL